MPTINDSKKEEERKFVDIFLQTIGCKCELQANESPDFIIGKDGSLVGLEVTAYSGEEKTHGQKGGSKRIAAQRTWISICASKKDFFSNSIKESTLLYFTPIGYEYPSKGEICQFAEDLAALANDNAGEDTIKKAEDFGEFEMLHRYIKLVHLVPSISGESDLCFSFGGGPIGAVPLELYNIVKEKSEDAEKFHDFAELILLIYDVTYIQAGSLRFNSGSFKRDAKLKNMVRDSQYNRVFLLSLAKGIQVMEIYPQAGKIWQAS